MEAEELRLNLKLRSKAERDFVQNLASGGTTGGGIALHGGGGYLADAIVPVQLHWTIDIETGTRLLSFQLPPLELVLLFTREWRA